MITDHLRHRKQHNNKIMEFFLDIASALSVLCKFHIICPTEVNCMCASDMIIMHSYCNNNNII